MNFGVNTWVWVAPLTTAEAERLVPLVAEMGFDWVEFPIEEPNGFDYARAGELAQAHGLGVSVAAAMGQERDLIHPDASIRANGVAFVEHCIDAAHTMRARNLIGPIYAAVGRTWQATPAERARDVELLVQQLSRLADYAGERGVTLCIEPLNRFETSFLNLAEQGVEIIDRVNHPACQLMLDTFHANIEEKSLGDAIRMVGPRLKHFHACENDRGIPGSGHLPWGDVAAALRDIGYDGPVVIESFTDKVKSIARAAAIWRPLAASPDALARNGLAFLQTLFAD
ncbi:MAG: sugar phosphate isomerase/epimerase [Caldilineaceae bacterium]|nr:sugar phosphate isomerase/epimerase [Caldilineaceae bacterium]